MKLDLLGPRAGGAEGSSVGACGDGTVGSRVGVCGDGTEGSRVGVFGDGRRRVTCWSTIRVQTNSNDFFFWELISRFEIDFRRCGICFWNDSNFWCVQSSITHNLAVHVHVLWPVSNVVVSLTIHDDKYLYIYM